jgi:predicted MFS family arabinose efflux permease
MWSRDLVLVLAAVACLFLNYPVLLIVGPVAYQQAGGPAGQAGFVTALFSGATVATELLSPGLLARLAPGRVLVASLGLMSLGTLASTAAVDSPSALLALAPVRGVGFGAAVVAMSVLVTELAPARRRGAALGWLGLTTSLPTVFGPALGLALLEVVGAAGVFAFSGLATLLGMGLATGVRQGTQGDSGIALGTRRPPGAPPAAPGSVWQGLRRRDLLVPFVALVLLSASYGGFVSYAALALPGGAAAATTLFLAYGVCRALARWGAGSGSDRFGARPLALGGTLAALVALLVLAGSTAVPGLGARAEDARALAAPGFGFALLGPLLAAGMLFGAGQGLSQGAMQVGMLDHPDPAEVRLGSTLWNMGVDAGVSVGGAGLALVASRYGLDAVFRTLPLFAAASLFVLASAWRPPRPKVSC